MLRVLEKDRCTETALTRTIEANSPQRESGFWGCVAQTIDWVADFILYDYPSELQNLFSFCFVGVFL